MNCSNCNKEITPIFTPQEIMAGNKIMSCLNCESTLSIPFSYFFIKQTEMGKKICPVCDEVFDAHFSDIELGQGGKKLYCPFCNFLLWIPVRGDSHPVPLIPYSQKNFRQILKQKIYNI